MTPEERDLIAGLFERMRGMGAIDKDREAEDLIARSTRQVPDAAYMLVQSVLVQEHALQEAGARIEELEDRVRDLERGQHAQAEQRVAQVVAPGGADQVVVLRRALKVADHDRHQVGLGGLGEVQAQAIVAIVAVLGLGGCAEQQGGHGERQERQLHEVHGFEA